MAGAASSQAQTYSVTDLGVAAGDNQSLDGGINGLGQAAGTSSNASNSSNGIALRHERDRLRLLLEITEQHDVEVGPATYS
jgi:hypothetical protein